MNYIKSLHIEGFKKFTSLNVEFNEHMNMSLCAKQQKFAVFMFPYPASTPMILMLLVVFI